MNKEGGFIGTVKRKHTPGSWYWMNGKTLLGKDTHVVLLGEELETRDEQTGLLIPLTPEHANACLIKEAPNLLEWSKDLVERLHGNPQVRFDPDTADSYRMLKKFIAKAGGRE